jgi:hypothetical protein
LEFIDTFILYDGRKRPAEKKRKRDREEEKEGLNSFQDRYHLVKW